MITCVVEYVIDPAKIDAFERFAPRWMKLVDLHGGTHHGYFLPAEGASGKALALFSFPSLAAYEQYRALFGTDPELVAADRIRDEEMKAGACSVTNKHSCAHCFQGSRKRGGHIATAACTKPPLRAAPRADPSVRDYRTGLLPWVSGGKACLREGCITRDQLTRRCQGARLRRALPRPALTRRRVRRPLPQRRAG